MIIVIDDERTFYANGEDVVHLRTSQEALVWFAKYVIDCELNPQGSVPRIDEIWFDHDLGEKSEEDAVVVAKFISVIMAAYGYEDDCLCAVNAFNKADIYIHTQNPVGAKNLFDVFYHRYNKPQIVPLPPLI